uniref:AlNc14C475G11852 protein n=1 Tax=Albugo laibachii Nc14 TaxID=890382 RepID=F0X0B5_9STRA|nr:AlNc14C475G11852 [Albugo laibachii Nc14]|eukprot:CCA27198.1 AlNc14C475G11852 [Albugo laibachii Nc14]
MPSVEYGANSLRGGRRTFGSATLIGNYVEERQPGKSQLQNASLGWDTTKLRSNSDKSTAHDHMMQGARRFPKRFGGGLAVSDSIKTNRIIANNLSKQETSRESITHSFHANTGIPTEFAAGSAIRGGVMSPLQLETHRNRWIRGHPERFTFK